MMNSKFMVIYLILFLSGSVLETEAQQPETNIDPFVSDALSPIWKATTIRDPLFFIQAPGQEQPSARLLFKPGQIKQVNSADRALVFVEGRDYVYDAKSNSLKLPKGSRISFLTHEELYPLMTSDRPKIARQAGDKTRGLFFDNKAGYHHRQVEVVYEFEPGQWKGFTPQFAGDRLPNTLTKLKAGKPLKIFLSGDSISAGYNASKYTEAKPGCPAYGELVALGLSKHYGSPTIFRNFAVGGWNADRGLKQVINDKLGNEKPDLVIIAFGMNDVFARNPENYQTQIKGIMQQFRKSSPSTEFILVATMLGNSEWGMPMEQFASHREKLIELCGSGVVLADLTSVWEELLKHKSFYDLTGNGVNHPNDFGHVVYAQTVLSLLISDLGSR